ncbi:hypothetical protein SAMN05446037_1006155 [Anaerovirgula multivorans]|uniref:Uncharacterized protein n=1 Tax=Anaerovirgula multivorans TaxID=312168 RepID=A0A239CVH3_9FIRM|nr:hypothetical protein [Anaerovirgula multivorans]SNS23661.1 hypothetical protein SAMN05446037_1006155 [Anaerovirgula multivorans]
MRTRLEPYIQNNVLSLRKLKEVSPALYKYMLTCGDEYNGIEILDDSKVIKGGDIKKYLTHYYGEVVDVSRLRRGALYIYNKIVSMGNVQKVIEGWGFTVIYEGKATEYSLKKDLQKYVIRGNILGRLPKDIQNKVWYLANKNKMSVGEYLNKLGYIKGTRKLWRRYADDKS